MKTKKCINLTINEKIWEEFSQMARETAINKSLLIELYIRKWIKENKN